ncbi:MAG: glycosyltransferase family 4 protein [Acidobacteria bacterium]|nr:glycosyltransferase family 4 protein [Acidobacteriota bacterium]
MRIRFLTSTPADVRRGSGTYVGIHTLAAALRDLGESVELVTPKVHLPVYTLERLLFNEGLRFGSVRECDLTVGFDLDGYRLAGGCKIPHVASLKGVIADELRFEEGLTRATMSIQARCEAMHVRRAGLVMTTSRYAASGIERFYGVRAVAVVPEPIDLAHWGKLLAAHPSEREPGGFTVLCVCRLYRRKRIGVLLGAAERLRARIPALEVRIVGDGPESAAYKRIWREKRLEGTVRFLGDISQARLAAEYNRCDVFCLPSVQEGFGIVFLEAMAAGKPVVATRAAAVPEVVPHGLLANPESEQATAAAIESLYRDAGLRAAQAASGLEWVRQFDAPRVARLFLDAVTRAFRLE